MDSKKRCGRSRYLLSVTVKVGQDKNGENGIDARIVCVRNRNNRKDWIAIICTDMSLSENDIIRIYGHRWDIEVFFKSCKSSLLLRKVSIRLPNWSKSYGLPPKCCKVLDEASNTINSADILSVLRDMVKHWNNAA